MPFGDGHSYVACLAHYAPWYARKYASVPEMTEDCGLEGLESLFEGIDAERMIDGWRFYRDGTNRCCVTKRALVGFGAVLAGNVARDGRKFSARYAEAEPAVKHHLAAVDAVPYLCGNQPVVRADI